MYLKKVTSRWWQPQFRLGVEVGKPDQCFEVGDISLRVEMTARGFRDDTKLGVVMKVVGVAICP
ncbi:MAG TPA: hypothetical protein DCW94_05765 [Porticoccaceae bacterium]|nr:hypothetical protein [Porticoccaceae bacterium]